MSVRKLIAAIAVAMTALTAPSYADDAEKGIKVDAEFAGSITGSSIFNELPDSKSDGPGISTGYSVSGHCTFAGVLTPNNRLNVTYGGFATGTGPQVPQLTYVKCSVQNALATPQTDFVEVASGGPASAATDTAGPWNVSPITVCVEAFVIFGPTPVIIVHLQKTCHSIVA